jgi:hypothetical protein
MRRRRHRVDHHRGVPAEGAVEPTVPRWARLAVVAVAIVFVVAGLRQAASDSPTVDEGVDLAGGLSHLVHHDLRMSPEHPILPKVLAALPALAADPIVPRGESWREGDWFGHTDATLAANDRAGRLHRVLFLSRLVPLAEAVACGALLYRLARRLAGEAAGLLAAGLWFTTPFVLGLGHLQSIDVAFTLATLAVSLALLRHREDPTLRRAAVVGVTLALALATRHTALVLVPIALVVVAVAPGARALAGRAAAVAGGVGYAGLWAIYRALDPTAPTGAPAARYDGLVASAGARSTLVKAVLAVPTPPEWQAGFAYLTLTSDPRKAWLMGRAWSGTQWWFYPASLVAKVPLPAVLVLALAAVAWWRRPGPRRMDMALTVALPGLVLLAFTMVQPLALGLRLALPSLALWMVAAGAGADLLRGHRVGRVALAIVAVAQIAALLAGSSRPMAWSPPPFRPAYRWVSDANLDFGQDLYRVRRWAATHDEPWVSVIAPRGLSVGGASRDLIDADPAEVTGWVAVGATRLTVVSRDELAWLRAYCPVGTLGGGSVLLYRFAEPPSARPGPVRPVAPCLDDEVSSRRAPAG